MATIQNPDNDQYWWVGATGTLTHCWWEYKMVQLLWETVWQFPTKLNILLPYSSIITLVGTYPNELKTCLYRNLHTDIYSSFVHNCHNLQATKMLCIGNEWINCGVSYSEYYSVINTSELSSHENTLRNLNYILVSEINQ